MKYLAHIVSICNWASEGVGYSDAMIDYPFIPKPGSVIHDYVDLYRTWSRHPDTKQPLWIDEPATKRHVQEVEEEGINSMGADSVPPLNNPIDASLCNCQISNAQMVIEIDEDPKYLIWGVHERDGEDLPEEFEDWLDSDPVSAERKTTFDGFMLTRGTPFQVLSDYWADNPGATYLQVVENFGLFL